MSKYMRSSSIPFTLFSLFCARLLGVPDGPDGPDVLDVLDDEFGATTKGIVITKYSLRSKVVAIAVFIKKGFVRAEVVAAASPKPSTIVVVVGLVCCTVEEGNEGVLERLLLGVLEEDFLEDAAMRLFKKSSFRIVS